MQGNFSENKIKVFQVLKGFYEDVSQSGQLSSDFMRNLLTFSDAGAGIMHPIVRSPFAG